MTSGFGRTETMVIRADANSRIGAGHVMRTLALAQLWTKLGGRVVYAMEPTDQLWLLESLRQASCKIEEFPVAHSHDPRRLVNVARQNQATAVVVDGYRFDESYLESIGIDEWVTLVLDDQARLRDYHCDLILNQNIGASADDYRDKTTARLLLGTRYSLLRSEFTRWPQSRFAATSGHRILVSFGGAACPSVVQTTIRSLHPLESRCRFRIVLGRSKSAVLEASIPSCPDHRFQVVSHSPDMSVHYRWADLAIAGGGSSNWEMCYFGLPRVLLLLAENQRGNGEHLHRAGVAINLGHHTEVTDTALTMAVNSLVNDSSRRIAMAAKAVSIVDGGGADRVVQQLQHARQVRATGNAKQHSSSVGIK